MALRRQSAKPVKSETPTEDAPTRKTRKSRKIIAPPPLINSGDWVGYIFDEEEAGMLVPNGMTANCPADRLILELHYAFEDAISADRRQSAGLAPDETGRAWCKKIAALSRELSEMLGVPDQSGTLFGPVPPEAYISGLMELNLIAVAPLTTAGLPSEVMGARAVDLAFRKREPTAREFSASIQNLLIQLTPKTLGVLTFLAEEREKSLGGGKKGGDKADTLGSALFCHLARIHENAFGCRPDTRNSAGYPTGVSIDWARRVITLAAIRLPSRTREPEIAGRAMSLHELSVREAITISDRLDEGFRFWSERLAKIYSV